MLGTIIFIILALIAVVSAIGMLTSTNAVHAALYLVLNFTCIALFYLGLNAPFLAMVQITVYAGAIMVLFLFVIMLLGAEQMELGSRLRWQAPVGLVLVVSLIIVAALILFSPQVQTNTSEMIGPVAEDAVIEDAPVEQFGQYGSPRSVGAVLFSKYLLPFEMVGFLLLVALVGAVVLARDDIERVQRRRKQLDMPENQKVPAGELPSRTK